MKLALIAAIGKDHAIAIGDILPWQLPDDILDYRAKIKGHAVLMGRKTYELSRHPRKNSPTIVITRNPDYQSDAIVFHSIAEGIRYAQESGEKMLFVLGGEKIYEETLPAATDLYLTHVDGEFPDATVFFPQVNWQEWEECQHETTEFKRSERNSHAFIIKHYIRRRFT